jgi:hypothetical protein
VRRQHSQTAPIADNVTVSDLNVIPDRDIALKILEQVAQTSSKTIKRDSQSFAVWLYPAGLSEFAEAIEHRDGENGQGDGNDNGLVIPGMCHLPDGLLRAVRVAQMSQRFCFFFKDERFWIAKREILEYLIRRLDKDAANSLSLHSIK